MAVTPFPGALDHLIVGQQFKVLVGYSTVIIECQCEAKTVLVLPGKGRVTPCPACGKQFVIAQSSSVQIGQVTGGMPVPPSAEAH